MRLAECKLQIKIQITNIRDCNSGHSSDISSDRSDIFSDKSDIYSAKSDTNVRSHTVHTSEKSDNISFYSSDKSSTFSDPMRLGRPVDEGGDRVVYEVNGHNYNITRKKINNLKKKLQ